MNMTARPSAIVLTLDVIGLALVRALAEHGITVYGVSRWLGEPGRASRKCKLIDLHEEGLEEDEAFCHWLADYARKLGDRPIVFPTSDEWALMLARHRDRLRDVCRFGNNSLDELSAIIRKNTLYQTAAAAGILVPPGLTAPQTSEVKIWCEKHRGPYLVKPYYNFNQDFKVLVFNEAKALLGFLEGRDAGATDLVIQSVLRGGDGWVFEVHGVCDRLGKIKTMASHVKIRQFPPDFGITSCGEAPAIAHGLGERALFEETERLLALVRYHGIFGIEWLQDRDNGELYLLDFNARASYPIGLLRDSGLNLPVIAYRELCGDDLSDVELTPKLTEIRWVDFWNDARTFRRLRSAKCMSWSNWIASLLGCRSYAVWSAGDPGPAFALAKYKVTEFLKRRFCKQR